MIKVYSKGTNDLIFFKQIYFIVYDPTLERDVQDVFITKVEIKGNSILIHNEIGYIYSFNMNNYKLSVIKGNTIINHL